MIIGPKYKIAKRLGSAVFEKTQTSKFALLADKKGFSLLGARSRSNYGTQLLEKQKVRFTYGITAKQLTKYVNKVIESGSKEQEGDLFITLEKRLDNVVLRSGLAKTRQQARQIVSHGHLRVNDKKMKVPSYQVRKDDVVTVKESSRESALFAELKETVKDTNVPAWLSTDADKFQVTVLGTPTYSSSDVAFKLGDVLQFYKR